MPLREWQLQFQCAVLGTDNTTVPLREQGIAREISIGIYANAYRERLHEALRSNFPALHRLLGDRDFAELAYAFTAAQPPTTASIRWFGEELPHYLRSKKPFCDLPIFGELAQFEWALRHTIDARDAQRIDTDHLQSLTAEQWETFTCNVHPSLTILHFRWNAPQVWRALDTDEAPPAPTPFDSYWFVYRGKELLSEWRSADAYEAAAIQLWSRDKNFGDICEFLAAKIGDTQSAVAAAAAFLHTWIQQGLLVRSQRGEKNNADTH